MDIPTSSFGMAASSSSEEHSDGAGAVVKISQRPSKSCSECIRRKTRCNKQIPCELCLKRGVAHMCRLESQFGAPPPASAAGLGSATSSPFVLPADLEGLRQSIFAEIESLRKRVYELERQRQAASYTTTSTRHANGVGTGAGAGAGVGPSLPVLIREGSGASVGGRGGPPGRPGCLPPKLGDEVETEDAATTLEFLALGLDRRLGAGEVGDGGSGSRVTSPDRQPGPAMAPSHILPEPADRTFPESVTDALLPRPNVTAVLTFAESHTLWQHCCVFFPRFWTEVDAFWVAISESWSKVEPTWVALLYTVMGIAVHQMTDEDAGRCGLSEADRLVLPNALVSAAEDALYAGQFLSRPTLWTVQTIAILTLCGHNVCESDLLSSLLAVGIKTAQTLNLHSLGRTASQMEKARATGRDNDHNVSGSGNSVNSAWSRKVVDLELGKRLWWALAQEDWFAIPFRGVWSIHPDHFDTPIPNNCHDADLTDGVYINRPDTELSVAFKMRFSSQVSSVLESYFRRVNRANTMPTFALAEDAASQIRSLIASVPSSLQPGSTPTPSHHSHPHSHHSQPYSSATTPAALPIWAQGMRHYIQISATHKILVVYRAFLAGGGTPRERAKAHAACVEAAETIVAEVDRGSRQKEVIQSLWTVPYHAVAAAVVLAMDMIALQGRPEAGRRRDGVMRARTALERLAPTSRIARRGLQVIADLLREAEEMTKTKRRRSSDSMARMVKKIKLPANEMIPPSTPSPAEQEHPTPTPTTTMQLQPPLTGPGPSPDDAMFAMLDFSQEETNQLLLSLQQSMPDVGRLFDGSIGTFGWPT